MTSNEFSQQEYDIKEAIIAFLKAGVRGRVQYKQQKRISEAQDEKNVHDEIMLTFSDFWYKCIRAFEKELSNIDQSQFYLIELETEGDEEEKDEREEDNDEDEFWDYP